MAISDLTQKITKDARDKSADIAAQSQDQINKIASDTEAVIQTKRETFAQELKATQEANVKKISASAEQEAKMTVDEKKRQILNGTFKEALTKLQTIQDKEYEVIITKLLKTIKENKDVTITTPKNRIEVTKKALTALKLTIPVKETKDITGGFIMTGDNFEYNFSFEKVISDKKNKLEIDVANILFA